MLNCLLIKHNLFRYPFQPIPNKVNTLENCKIKEVSGGEGYSVALSQDGRVYSWGASACGQLGICSLKELPIDIEGYPYNPIPTLVDALANIKVKPILLPFILDKTNCMRRCSHCCFDCRREIVLMGRWRVRAILF